MAVGGDAGVAQEAAVGGAGEHGRDDRDAGQNSAVSRSTARMISGFSGDGALSTGVPVGVTEIWSSASTRTSVF